MVDTNELKDKIEKLTGKPESPDVDEDNVVAVVEYRGGTLIDSAHRVKK